MNEMEERVALAIWAACPADASLSPSDIVKLQARAAIEAMREPTDEMIKAGVNLWCERAWDAMIDAALAGAQAGG